jgi:hypothetical protein
VRARQGLDVFLVCFRSLHVSQVGGLEETDQSVGGTKGQITRRLDSGGAPRGKE